MATTKRAAKRTRRSSSSTGAKDGEEEEDKQSDGYDQDEEDNDESEEEDDEDSTSALVSKLSVGSRVSVWWPLEKKYYNATVDRIMIEEEEDDANSGNGNDNGNESPEGSNTISKPHFLLYDDNDTEWTNLLHKKFRILESDTDEDYDDYGGGRTSTRERKSTTTTKKKKQKSSGDRTTPCRTYVPWEEHYEELQAYKKEFGHANPPLIRGSVNEDHYKLGMWLTGQQSGYRKGKLNEEKATKLRKLGCLGFDNNNQNGGKPKVTKKRPSIGTSTQGREQQHQQPLLQKQVYMRWDDRIQELLKYKEEHNGDANPRRIMSESAAAVESPSSSGGVANSLAQWLQDQRKKYRKGILSQQKIQQLHEMGCDGFGGENASGKLTRQRPLWDNSFAELQNYKERHGHANPKRSKGPDYKLGRWLSDQRQKFRDGRLTNPVLIQKFRDLGCSGFEENDEGERQQYWDETIEKLRAYKDREGHANPKRVVGSSKDDWKLASWLYYHQRQYAKGAMSQRKLDALRKLGCDGFDEYL